MALQGESEEVLELIFTDLTYILSDFITITKSWPLVGGGAYNIFVVVKNKCLYSEKLLLYSLSLLLGFKKMLVFNKDMYDTRCHKHSYVDS